VFGHDRETMKAALKTSWRAADFGAGCGSAGECEG